MSSGNWIAIVAVVASMLTVAYGAYRTQRLAREERRQSRLAETYVALMDYANRAIQYGSTAASSTGLPNLPFSEEEQRDLDGRVLAFASNEVRSLFEALSTAWIQTMNQNDTWNEIWSGSRGTTDMESPGRSAILEELERRRETLVQSAEVLIVQVRHELGSQSRAWLKI